MASLPPLAPVSALEVRLGLAVGSLSGVDLARAQADLDDVSSLVREASRGRTWVDTDGETITAPDVIVTVTVQATLRAYRNPDGFAGENMGSGAYGYQYGQDAQSGVYLTDDERAIVARAAVGVSGGVYTLRTPSSYYDPPLSGLPPYYVEDLAP